MKSLSLLLALSFAASAGADERYPAEWWQPPPGEKASWEILPQEAKPGEVILSKRNELGLLSNFAATPFTLDGVRYGSVEGFWQMMLYPEGPDDPRAKLGTWPHTREEVAAMTAFTAKGAGGKAKELLKPAGIDWVTYRGKKLQYKGKDQDAHYELIRRAMVAKMEQNPRVREILLATGDLELKPDHTQPPDKTRAYDYNVIWMELRKKAREEELKKAERALAHWLPENRARIVDAVLLAGSRPNRAAAFDGDGTLWHADVPREFLEFQVQHRFLKYFDYSADAAATVQRLYDTCKSDVSICIAQAAYLEVGLSNAELLKQANDFYKEFDKRVFPGQIELTRYLREHGFRVYLVSGGPKWLAEVAAKRWFEIPPENVIGVRTRVVDGVVSAEVIPPVPFRDGKLKAIAETIGGEIQIAAGNTGSDVPMLTLAKLLSVAINSFGPETKGFHYGAEQELIKEAKKRQWLIQKF